MEKKGEKKEKVKYKKEDLEMAIWFFNNLIERYPMVYKNLRRIYERRK